MCVCFLKFHFGRHFALFFSARQNFRFFLVFGVLGLDGALQEVVGRETLQNKGFRNNFAFLYLVNLLWTRCIASILHFFCFENKFCGSHKFVFSEVQIFDQIGFGRQKMAWGCRTEVVLKMIFFPFFPGEDQFVKFLVRGRVAFWIRVGPVATNGLAAAVRRVFRVFRGSSFDTVFANLKGDLLKLPSLLFVFYSFLHFLLGFGVNATLHVCFGAVGPKRFFSFCFCVSFLQNHWKTPEKGLFLFISLCLPFFLLGFIHFSFSLSPFSLSLSFSFSLSLSLNLFLVSCFSFIPCCFVFW